MKIHVHFATVMKLQFFTWIEVDDNPSLLQLKEKIYTVFWETMQRYIVPHGNPDHVILKDFYNIEVTTDRELKKSLKKSIHFSIAFQEHP